MLRTRQLAPHCRAIGLALAAVTTWILAPCQAVAQTEDVVFRAAVGVTVSGNDLTKTAAAGWGNAGAVSVQTIESNGFVEFSGNGSVMAGLGKGDTNQTYQDIEFAIYLNASTFQVYEAGNPKGTAASYVPSDKFRVEVEGSIVRYRKNGAVFYTSLVPAAFPLLFDCSLNTTGPNVVDARIGQTSYMADVAVSVSEGTLTKTGAVGWNAGAVSSRRIRSGDGSVEFTATETNKLRAAGLSNGDTDTTASDIDFAIVLKADATVEVQENGIPHGTSSYVTGDRFRIELQGGVVTYLKNSTVLYTSGVAPTYPLWADTALYDAGATLTDIVMSEISWTSTASVIASAGTLTKTGSAGWNAGAASTASITSGDGFVEFTASETNTTRACGLADSVSSYDPAQIDFAIQLLANGNMQVYESGTPRGTASAYASGDRFRVEVQYGQVVYRKNGLVFYTSQLVPPYPLKVETSFDTVGGTLREVRLGKLVWKNELGVQVWGYSLLNPSAWGWGNSGAASTVQLASGDGGVEYTATETGTIRMLGLSNGDPDRNTAIDFAIVATNGSVMVYQKGSQIGLTYGTYAIGDRLRVAVEGGVVKYRRNGTLLYTSNQPIVYPLLVDTSFFSAPTAMTEIVLLGNFTSGTLVVTDPTPSPAGGTFNTPQTVTVTCPVAGTDVHYTTDGSDPTTTSPTIACNGTLSISQTLTLKLRGWKAGWVTSNVVTTTYTMVAATPSFSPGPGTYTGAVTVTLSTITPGVTMLYTTNGVDPPGPGTLSGTSVTADRTMTIKARATRAGWTDSAVASGTYAMTMGTVATPTFAPAPGSYAGAQTVTLSSATSGATIRYTLDGSDPAFTSLLYTGPIAVASSQTVKARAYKLDWLVSGAASGTYTIGSGAAADPPLLSPPSGRYANGLRVTVTSPMAGTTIRYTTNGSDPVDTDPVVASGTTVQVERSMRLKARCWKTGVQPSGVASADYEIVGAVAAGGDHGLALRADGTVATWVMNAYGQLGDGTTTYRLTPVNVTGGLDDVIAIAAGYRHSVALKVDGTVWSWGDNGGGILGAGIADAYRTSPVQVVTSSGPLTGITAISAGLFHTMALKSDGTVWVWGQSNYGALGQGNLNTQTRAVQVPGLTGITAIVAGGWHSLALQTNGSTSGNVWGFGLNDSGQLLDGTTTNRLSPVLGSAQITLMGAGAQHTVVRKVDGTIWGAGYNLYGQLGNGTTVTPQSTLATAMNGVTGVTKISAGGHFTLVLKSSGEVWAAGWNASGSLGDGTNLDKSTPARTVVLRDTVDIAASNVVTDYYGNAVGYSVALTADGRVWTWGSNILYGLGQGGAGTDSLYRPQPLANFSVADQSWPLGDPDGDGLTTKEELTLGTDPFNPDTNGDGIGDGTAVRVGVSPTSLDTDGDGLTNAVEKTKGADPLRADTDGDGVSDGADCFPLDPTRTTCPTPQPGDVTPPVITLTEPVGAVLISSMP